MTSESEDAPVGFGRPPAASRFRKGQSGNPKGRPRNSTRDLPYNTILGQMVTVREDGKERRVTAAEAFLLQLTQRGLAGDSAAARATLAAIETARAKRPMEGHSRGVVISLVGMGIESVMGDFGLATKKYPFDEKKVRWELEPWIVEAALDRLGSRRLTLEEQEEVFRNTRTPHKVRWPNWWEVGE